MRGHHEPRILVGPGHRPGHHDHSDCHEPIQAAAMRPEIAELLASLDELRAIFPEATPMYLRDLGHRLINLEVLGRTRFGGAHVLAWWLVQRCTPSPARALGRRWGLSAAQAKRQPLRLQQGWGFMRLTTYVAGLG